MKVRWLASDFEPVPSLARADETLSIEVWMVVSIVEAALAVPIEEVAGDDQAGFYRLRDAPPPNPTGWTRVMEAYSWGGLTSGRASRAVWLLVLPFILIDLAPWMVPAAATRRRSAAIAVGLLLGTDALGGFLGVLQQDRFGQLQFQQLGRQLVFSQYPGQALDEIGLPHFQCGDIHRHHDGCARLFPAHGLLHGLLQHPRPQGDDIACFLGQRNENARPDTAQVRVRPAQKGLRTNDAA